MSAPRHPPGSRPLPLAPGPEFDLVRRFLGRVDTGAGVLVGPGDDCAVVDAGALALSTDMSIEGVHFRREWLEPEEIGWRAAAAALSDLAAVAARPLGILVSLAIPARDAGPFAERLMAGSREAVADAGGTLLGGDLTGSPGPVVLDVTVVGRVEEPVLRSGATAGEEVWVTGQLGGSRAFVEAMLSGAKPARRARERYARPRPRTREAVWLAERGLCSSMVDLSDGLAGDAGHLAAGSGVAIVLEEERVPVHPAADRALALSGGEDYELCFTSAAGALRPFTAEFASRFRVDLTRVGTVEPGAGVWIVAADGSRSAAGAGGWQHFGGAA
jgi:thiamine-monophosphate kinase